MEKTGISHLLTFLEPLACLLTLLVIVVRKEHSRFSFLTAFLAVRGLSVAFLTLFLPFPAGYISVKTAYAIYFYGYWGSYLLESILGFGIILGLYRLAMAPLPGLQRLGMLMFRWAGGIAIALATVTAVGPRMTGMSFTVKFVAQLQSTQSVLTLCMLLFVCLASRPMGLSQRSKIFGVSLGLGVLATSNLVSTAWFSSAANISTLGIINGGAICLTLVIWITYFARPEPRRRMIVLPTTSPFLRWNQISVALGDEPGFVTVGDFTPDMLAPAEVEVMRRASMKMRQAFNS